MLARRAGAGDVWHLPANMLHVIEEAGTSTDPHSLSPLPVHTHRSSFSKLTISTARLSNPSKHHGKEVPKFSDRDKNSEKRDRDRDHREDPIPWGNFHFSEAGPGMYVCMYVYYCRTYEKAVSRGGEGKGRTCAKGHH